MPLKQKRLFVKMLIPVVITEMFLLSISLAFNYYSSCKLEEFGKKAFIAHQAQLKAEAMIADGTCLPRLPDMDKLLLAENK